MHTWAFITTPQEYTGCILTTSKYSEPLVLADQERPHGPPGPLYPRGPSESHSTVDDTGSMKGQTDRTDPGQAACRRSD